MDAHEDLVVAGLFGWVSGPVLKQVEEYLESVKKYPPPLHPTSHSSKALGISVPPAPLATADEVIE